MTQAAKKGGNVRNFDAGGLFWGKIHTKNTEGEGEVKKINFFSF